MQLSEATPQPSPPVRQPTLRLVLVRHGETEDAGLFPDHSGHGDPPLSVLGREQALSIVKEIAGFREPPVAAVYASPLAAAMTTAVVIAETLGLPRPVPSPALVTIAPETLPSGQDGISTLTAIQDQAWSGVEMLRESFQPPITLVLVSHELPIRATICRALSIPLDQASRFRVDPASVSSLEFRASRTMLATLNHVARPDPSRNQQR